MWNVKLRMDFLEIVESFLCQLCDICSTNVSIKWNYNNGTPIIILRIEYGPNRSHSSHDHLFLSIINSNYAAEECETRECISAVISERLV